MSICEKCGTQAAEDTRFCPNCGAQMPTGEQPAPTAAPEPPVSPAAPAAEPEQNDFVRKLQALNETADTTAEFDPADIEQNRIMGLLSYLSWLVLVPIFAAKSSKFARFHANQGLVLAVTEIVWWILYAIVDSVLSAIYLGFISSILGLVNIGFLVLMLLGILNALGGKAKELPIIGKFRLLK